MVLAKLVLQIETPQLEEDEPGFACPDATASINLQSYNGDFKLVSNSLQEYRFTEQGLRRHAHHRPASAGRFYQISQKDIEIMEPLGEGASSTVYKGYFAREKGFVAVKRINCLEREKRQQIMNDIRGLCDVSHPALVQFIGAFRVPDSGQISIVLEYMDGGSLADLVALVGRVPEPVLSAMTAQVLQGLVYLHKSRHTVHRDIKPANILLSTAGRAKIADFGISAFVDNTLAVCNTFLGTVTYMSPERINSRPYSFAADIWSLGLLLLECAMGKYPYDASAGPLVLMMQVLNEPVPLPGEGECSEELLDFVGQCLRKDPFQRPDAETLLSHPFVAEPSRSVTDLQRYLTGLIDRQSSHRSASSAACDDEVDEDGDWHLEQQAEALADRYFCSLSAGATGVATLADDLATDVVLVHEGVDTQGKVAVMQRLESICNLQAALGASRMVVGTKETQLMKGGGALVLVTGHIEVTEAGPLGSALWDKGQVAMFAQALEMCRQSSGQLLISRSMFRHL